MVELEIWSPLRMLVCQYSLLIRSTISVPDWLFIHKRDSVSETE